ncbi:MAG: hypothetical protein WDN10_00770 [bacterium]
MATKRVITPYGLGTCQANAPGETIPVTLDVPYQGENEFWLARGTDVFDLSDHALMRIVYPGAFQTMQLPAISTVQFYANNWQGASRAFTDPGPPDETRLLLHFDTGRFELRGTYLDKEAYSFVQLETWMTASNPMNDRSYATRNAALDAFNAYAAKRTRVDGIVVFLLLDAAEKKILNCLFLGKSGIIPVRLGVAEDA